MNNIKTINKIQGQYGIDELKEMFVKRLDDDLFAQVGGAALSIPLQRKTSLLEKNWLGYEVLTNSGQFPYTMARLRAGG